MALGDAYSQTITTFDYTGAVQTFVVPAGVTEVVVDCIAASGGDSDGPGGTGAPHEPGLGGRVETTLTVTPGSTLNIYVGGVGETAAIPVPGVGGFNGGGDGGNGYDNYGGGGGGGASDIRVGGTALTDRVVVAGGGGGAGYNYGSGDNGGDGGGTTGEDGTSGGGGTYGPGTGGTPTAGGIGGYWTSGSWADADDGVLGDGGNAGVDGAGGGGGGGYYGGGGATWSGGGGGSSYADAGLTTGTVHTQGYNTGDGQVIITVLCNPLTVTVSDDTVCVGDEVTLTASGAGTITWDGGVTNGVAFTPPTGSTTYTATSDDGTDCGYEQIIFVGDLPSVDAGTDIDACEGEMVTLNGSGATDYTWDGGVTDGVAFTPPGGTTTYTVTGTVDSTGCENTDMVDVNVTVIDLTVTMTGTALVCDETGDSYQWIDCHDMTDITGETNQSYTPAGDGNYACEITLNGCIDTTECLGVTAGMEDFFTNHGINIYPVPASENLTIELNDGNMTFEILSMTGEILERRQIVAGMNNIDISHFSSGMYLISFSNEGEVYTKPLIVRQIFFYSIKKPVPVKMTGTGFLCEKVNKITPFSCLKPEKRRNCVDNQF